MVNRATASFYERNPLSPPQKEVKACWSFFCSLVSPITQFFQRILSKTDVADAQTADFRQRVVIIGSGPAAYTAAIYAARANIETVVYEGSVHGGMVPGGQLMTTTQIENYPGIPQAVAGPDLIEAMRAQALAFGASLVPDEVVHVDLSSNRFKVIAKSSQKEADALIIATGARAKRLEISGTRDHELWQKGVSACAICDGALPLFRDRHVFVIGGGDSAMEEALHLAKFANRVSIVHRRTRLRASKAMQNRVLSHPKIEVLWNKVIHEVHGKDHVDAVILKDVQTGKLQKQQAAGVFFAVGHLPNTGFLQGQIALDTQGYICVEGGSTLTSVPGVFAAGDVADPRYRQAITAAGMGCMAALDAERYLATRE